MLSQKLNIAPSSCHGWIIGEHGDSSVAVWSGMNVAGVTLMQLNPLIGQDDDPEDWRSLHKKVIDSAYEIIKLKGYTSWAIGLSVSSICTSIIRNLRQVFALSVNVQMQFFINFKLGKVLSFDNHLQKIVKYEIEILEIIPVSVVEQNELHVNRKPVPILNLTPETSAGPPHKPWRQKRSYDLRNSGAKGKDSKFRKDNSGLKMDLNKVCLNSSRRIIEDIVKLELCDVNRVARRHFKSLMPMYRRQALRKKMEKNMHTTILAIAERVRQIQQSIVEMLRKLELQENLDW
ncbi:unnamed protein product [Soboliphyme baturini]|uniref:L-lactate dehydrogenase n=1 Tax=Soboliphyme baturini TaxID=241478 RepID=A0A183IXM1_9BILA|nr:unnamed protein product [Soboliphyme baturini]